MGKNKLRSDQISQWLTRRAVSATLIVVFAVLLSAPLGIVSAQSRPEIDLECPCSYNGQGNSVTLNASKVTFNGSGRTGTLKLMLWATTTRYAGGAISGYRLAEGRLGELRTNEYFDSPSPTVPYTPPPAGTYYITMIVTEYDNGEDIIVDHATFDRTVTVGGGSGTGTGGAGGDSFSSRSGISGASGRVTGSNVGASKEFGEPNHAGNAGGASVWWSWTAPATGTVTFDTQGSDFDTLLAVYRGSSVGALAVVASDDDTIGRQSEVSFAAQQGVVYHIAVDGYSGATGAIVLNWQAAPDDDSFLDDFLDDFDVTIPSSCSRQVVNCAYATMRVKMAMK